MGDVSGWDLFGRTPGKGIRLSVHKSNAGLKKSEQVSAEEAIRLADRKVAGDCFANMQLFSQNTACCSCSKPDKVKENPHRVRGFSFSVTVKIMSNLTSE